MFLTYLQLLILRVYLLFWLNSHTCILMIVMIFVWLVITLTYVSTVVLLILLKVDIDTSAPYPMISDQRHKASTRRNLLKFRIYHYSSAIESIDHYTAHIAPQGQVISRTCTEPASHIATRSLHPLILLHNNTKPLFWLCLMTNKKYTIPERLLHKQQTLLNMTLLPWVSDKTTERKRRVLPWIG